LAINQDIKALIPNKSALSNYILHLLIGSGPRILATCLKSGTTVESIEFPWLKAFQVPVPPTNAEQEARSCAGRHGRGVLRARSQAVQSTPDQAVYDAGTSHREDAIGMSDIGKPEMILRVAPGMCDETKQANPRPLVSRTDQDCCPRACREVGADRSGKGGASFCATDEDKMGKLQRGQTQYPPEY
jgi:hypothetical protein